MKRSLQRKIPFQYKSSAVMKQGFSNRKCPVVFTSSKSTKQTHRLTGLKKLPYSLLLCGNTAGHMINPSLICQSNHLKMNKKSLTMFWQLKKPWVMAILFLKQFHKCPIPQVRKYPKDKRMTFQVLLTIDTAPTYL